MMGINVNTLYMTMKKRTAYFCQTEKELVIFREARQVLTTAYVFRKVLLQILLILLIKYIPEKREKLIYLHTKIILFDIFVI